MNGNATSAEGKLLVQDTGGEVAHSDCSYSSVMGMMLYHSGPPRPDIGYTVYCATCYIFYPGHSHELYLNLSKSYTFKRTHSQSIIKPEDRLLS